MLQDTASILLPVLLKCLFEEVEEDESPLWLDVY